MAAEIEGFIPVYVLEVPKILKVGATFVDEMFKVGSLGLYLSLFSEVAFVSFWGELREEEDCFLAEKLDEFWPA